MDDRKIQLKNLKKAYLKERRRATWGWNVLCWWFFALLFIAVALLAYMVFYKTSPVRILDLYIWTPIKKLVGIHYNLRFLGTFVLKYAKWFILGFGVAFLLVWLLRNRAVSKTHRFDSYLDYMTLKNTLKTERDEERIK